MCLVDTIYDYGRSVMFKAGDLVSYKNKEYIVMYSFVRNDKIFYAICGFYGYYYPKVEQKYLGRYSGIKEISNEFNGIKPGVLFEGAVQNDFNENTSLYMMYCVNYTRMDDKYFFYYLPLNTNKTSFNNLISFKNKLECNDVIDDLNSFYDESDCVEINNNIMYPMSEEIVCKMFSKIRCLPYNEYINI